MMRLMALGLLMSAAGGFLAAGGRAEPPEGTSAGGVQSAAERPAEPGAGPTFRRPAQAEVIEQLLRNRERSNLILPQDPDAVIVGGESAAAAPGQKLLLEGTMLVERAGRLVRDGEKSMFEFVSEAGDEHLHSMELLPSQLLEAMENEAEQGGETFIVSGEVTRYRGRNYLRLVKVLRRVGHGNLAP